MNKMKKIILTIIATAVLVLGMQVASQAADVTGGETVTTTISFASANVVDIDISTSNMTYVSASSAGSVSGGGDFIEVSSNTPFTSVTLTFRVADVDGTASATMSYEAFNKGATVSSSSKSISYSVESTATKNKRIADEQAAEAARQKAAADEAARKAAEAEAARKAQEQQSSSSSSSTPSYVDPTPATPATPATPETPAVVEQNTTNDVSANVVDANTIANTTVDNTVKTENTVSNTTKTTGTVETVEEESEGIKPIIIVAICAGTVLLICVGYYIFIVKRKKRSKSKPSGFDDF